MEVNEDILCLMAGQKKLEDKYKDPNVMPKINKPDMEGTMKTIKEYLRLCLGVIQAPFSHVIRKTIIVQTYGNYSTCETPDSEMIARMLQLPIEKNEALIKTNAQTVQVCMAE